MMISGRCASFWLLLIVALETNAVLIAQPAPDTPGIPPGSLEATAFAGLSLSQIGERGTPHLQIENTLPFGGRISHNFDKHSAAEFSIANPFAVSANYVYHLSPVGHRWVPYATAGIGGSRLGLAFGQKDGGGTNTNQELNEGGPGRTQTALAGNFGGGIKYLLTDHFALRLDARDVVGRYAATFASVELGKGASTINASRFAHDVQITGGFVFRFGGH